MSVEETVEDYYESVRRGEPLYPYFLESPTTVKIGIGERLIGYDEVAEGLREQTRTTDDWTIESHALRTSEPGDDDIRDASWDSDNTGRFDDVVRMQWRDTSSNQWRDFETRWTGTLVLVDSAWQFVSMHVSAAVDGDGRVRSVLDDVGKTGTDSKGRAS